MATTSGSDTALRRIRMVMLACIAIMLGVTVFLLAHAGVKAPLLTMMGSVTVIITLYPPSMITMQNTGTLLGTGMVMGGGGYWLRDAVERSAAIQQNANELLTISLLASFLTVLLAIYVFVSMLTTVDWNDIRRAIRRIRR